MNIRFRKRGEKREGRKLTKKFNKIVSYKVNMEYLSVSYTHTHTHTHTHRSTEEPENEHLKFHL